MFANSHTDFDIQPGRRSLTDFRRSRVLQGHSHQSTLILPFLARFVAFVTIAGLGLSLAGCSSTAKGGDGEAAPTQKQTTPEVPPPPVTWPLTGVVVDGSDAAGLEAVKKRPTVSVKIENSAAARPQSGLEVADIVYEEMIEGGSTRFNAVWHSTLPTSVGPVRSVRPVDVPLSLPLGGILAFSGGQDDFIYEVRNSGMVGLDEDHVGKAATRTRDRRMPHNLYYNTEMLAQNFGSELTAPKRQWPIVEPPVGGDAGDGAGGGTGAEATPSASAEAKDSAGSPSSTSSPATEEPADPTKPSAVSKGQPAAQIIAKFPAHRAGWSWSGVAWLRYDDGVQSVAASGTPLVAANVVVLQVETFNTRYRDGAGSPVPDTKLLTSGKGWVASGGHILPITWSKASNAESFQFTDENGMPVVLNSGATWVELVPINGGLVEIS